MSPVRRRFLSHRSARYTDLDFCDRLSLVSGWYPPVTEFGQSRSRWQTWGEFFAEYELLRGEFLESSFARAHAGEPFAETEYREWIAARRPDEWRVSSQCQECGAPLYFCSHVEPDEDELSLPEVEP